LGRTELPRTLNTGDLREANRLKHRVLAALQEEASRAALAAELHPDSVEYLAEAARMQREAMKAGLDEHTAEAGLDAAVENWLERMARKFGTGHDGAPLLPETKERAVRLAYRVFRGDQPDLLSDYVEKHLKELAPRITASALATKAAPPHGLQHVGRRRRRADDHHPSRDRPLRHGSAGSKNCASSRSSTSKMVRCT
jgi:hypothetical protein